MTRRVRPLARGVWRGAQVASTDTLGGDKKIVSAADGMLLNEQDKGIDDAMATFGKSRAFEGSYKVIELFETHGAIEDSILGEFAHPGEHKIAIDGMYKIAGKVASRGPGAKFTDEEFAAFRKLIVDHNEIDRRAYTVRH